MGDGSIRSTIAVSMQRSIGYNYKRDRYSRLPFNQSTVMHVAYRVAWLSADLGAVCPHTVGYASSISRYQLAYAD